MKKITYFLFALTILLTACEGDQGPPGLNGFNGETAPAFEVTRSFNSPNYDANVAFGFDVYPDEVVLVYILWETLDDGTQVWRQMPQTVIFEDGNDLVYNFDFTQFDVQLFLDGSNLDILDSVWTQNQRFRIIVIPTTNYNRADYSDIETVMSMYGIEEFEQR
ncbi:hypothetical protein DFQ10_102371 [Winogradskyella eximia]|uniref:Uncharacterized protein n=1 Tax=Winogradskyella eximia TaxID=262006 RepID=A0A3D9H7M8_9FLAO|nr:hypothetical protein [Winogradskyella eximia]RED45498.1 hypothetical protein DFQ10_102371 [Winogradskyella eximia]